jgi:hypothetical protein
MDLREIGWGGMDWINLTWDGDQRRVLVNMVMNLRVPLNVGEVLDQQLLKKDSASCSYLFSWLVLMG